MAFCVHLYDIEEQDDEHVCLETIGIAPITYSTQDSIWNIVWVNTKEIKF